MHDPNDHDDYDDYDGSYFVIKVIWWKGLIFSHKIYLVIKAKEVKIVKEVKRSDGLWRFACCRYFGLTALQIATFTQIGMGKLYFWDKKQQKCIIRKRWLDTFWYQIAEEVGVRVIVIGRHIYLPKREKTPLWIACFSYILINLRSQPEAMKIFWKKMRKCWSATLRFF